MKTKFFTLSAIAAAFIASHASAAIMPYDDFVDIDIYNQLIAPSKNSAGAEIQGGGIVNMFDITGNTALDPDGDGIKYDKHGFLPSQHVVTNVALAFSFYKIVNNSRVWAQIDIDLSLGDAGVVAKGSSDSLESGDFPDSVFEFNYILDTSPVSGPTSLTDEVAVKLIADVQADGKISWGIDVGSAEGIYLFAAGLGVEAARVPDTGSTLALLGSCIFGFVILGRRRVA